MKIEIGKEKVERFMKSALQEGPIFQKGNLKFVLISIELKNDESLEIEDWNDSYFHMLEKIVFNVKGLHKKLATLVEVYPSGTIVVSPGTGRDIEKLKRVF